MNTLKAQEGKWLFNGESFAKEVASATEIVGWEEVDDQYKEDFETLKAQNAEKIAELEANLENSEKDLIKAIEQYLAANAEGEVKELAEQRISMRNQIDSLGKVVQTAQGNGSMQDPYKVWKVGMTVKSGDWWMTDDGYLWQAKKDGVPSSSTDAEYWDIP